MKRMIAIVICSVVLLANSYNTNFPANENPISQGGNWINGAATGLDWHNIQTSSSQAYGTQPGSTNTYDDSTAVLTGTWGADQTVTGTVHTVNQNNSIFEEVELRLRTIITAHSITGYEALWRVTHDGTQYLGVVRWNGPLGNFTGVGATIVGPGIVDGDVVKATIVGNIITQYTNGAQVNQVDITSISGTVYTSGPPGIGHNFDCAGNCGTSVVSDYGFTQWSATDNINSFKSGKKVKRTR